MVLLKLGQWVNVVESSDGLLVWELIYQGIAVCGFLSMCFVFYDVQLSLLVDVYGPRVACVWLYTMVRWLLI